jgi:hypothetical protein
VSAGGRSLFRSLLFVNYVVKNVFLSFRSRYYLNMNVKQIIKYIVVCGLNICIGKNYKLILFSVL